MFGKPSRGHYVVVLTITRRKSAEDDGKSHHRSHLFIVDLPGYAVKAKPGASEAYQLETQNINNALEVFAQCLQSDRSRRPYKDSLLTTIIAPMLGEV